MKKEFEGMVTKTIETNKTKNKTIYMPFWCRSHWLTLQIKGKHAHVYDSAPSEVVRRDVEKWCKNKDLSASFEICPQQKRYSRECGLFVIGVIMGCVKGKTLKKGIVSLEEVRKKWSMGESPNVDMFKDMYTIQGSGPSESIQESHDRLESYAANKNLCFLLSALCLAKKGMEQRGENNTNAITRKTLELLTKSLRIKIKKGVAEMDDVEGALLKMINAGWCSVRLVPLSDIESIAVGEVAIVCKGDEIIPLPKYFNVIAATKFMSTDFNYFQASDGQWHRTANCGHYRYVEEKDGLGTCVLVHKTKAIDPEWTIEKAGEMVMERNKREAISRNEKVIEKVTGVVNKRPLRHAKITAILSMSGGKYVCGHWILNDEPANMIGAPAEDEDWDVEWLFKKCECGAWRKIEEPIREICPLPKATYIRFETIHTVQLCECGGDDNDETEDNTIIEEVNQYVEEQWGEQESLEPLGKVDRKAPLGMLTGGIGRNWKIITKGKPKKVHTLVWKSLAESTRKKHVEWLLHIQQMPADLQEQSFDRAVVELVIRMAKTRKWAWSTVSTIFSNIHSAMKQLDLYTTETRSYDLKESGYFLTAMRRAQKLARNAGPSTQLSKPLTPELFEKIFKSCEDTKVRTLLGTTWAFAARVGDLRQVSASNVKLPGNRQKDEPTAITFKKGKGGAFWGAYTIHTVLPFDVWKDLAKLLIERRKADSLWTATDQRKLATLMSNEGLNLRSIRRGALLHNAYRGVSDTDLQYLSGHKRIDTLMRYLGWGVESTSSKKAAKDRHKLLGGESEDTEPKKMGASAGFQGENGRRVEKPPCKYYFRPPSSAQLGVTMDPRKLPIHVKDVRLANMSVIKEMARKSKQFGTECLFALEHLTGKPYKKYGNGIPHADEIPKAGFSVTQLKKMIEYGKMEPLKGEGKAWVKGFPIVDGHKNRARALGEPFVNNFTVAGEDYPTMSYPSRLEQFAAMRDAKFVAQFDYAAYFDQFGLEEEAKDYMVMRTKPVDGTELWRLTRLPMGATFSPCIAQYTTWVICEPLHDIQGVKVTTMIDNVRIVASTKEAFIKAVRLFLSRSDEAGLTINPEGNVYRTTDDKRLAKIGKENTIKAFEFLGACYENGTVRNTDRLVTKMTLAEKRIEDEHLTRRQLAHIIGLAIFMSHTIQEEMVNHFDLMRLYNKLFEGNPTWDEKFTPTTQLKENLYKLTAICIANKRVTIRQLIPPSINIHDYDAVIVFDACKDAWAAKVHLIKENKRLRILKRFERQIKFSAHAEPAAATEILKIIKDKYKEVERAALVTDHKALAMGQKRWWTGFGGHSTAFFINEAFKQINNYAEVFHVDGEHNITDTDSRSMEARECKEIKIIECDEKWYGLENVSHPYAEVRRDFKYF